MLQNRAVRIIKPGDAQVVDAPLSDVPHGYMLVKITAVGINPADWWHVDHAEKFPCIGCTVGCDYAGVVEQAGEGGSKTFRRGDRVTGIISGS